MSCKKVAIPYAQLRGRILPTQFSGFLTPIWGVPLRMVASHTAVPD